MIIVWGNESCWLRSGAGPTGTQKEAYMLRTGNHRDRVLLALAAALFALAGTLLFLFGPWSNNSNDEGPIQLAGRTPRESRVPSTQAAELARQREAKRLADQQAKRLAEQEELERSFSTPVRWRILPQFVRGLRIDRAGGPWYHLRDESSSEEALRQSVERSAMARVATIRSGRLLLTDRAGRIWVCPDRDKHRLLCYCTLQKTWQPERLATGEETLPATLPTAETYRGVFTDVACEDSAGNVYFVGGAYYRGGYGIHRLDKSGTWTYRPVVPERTFDHWLLDRPIVLEQPGGRIAICPRRPSQLPPEQRRALYFDGKTWQEIDPRVCHNDLHILEAMLPLPNGAIGTLCGDRFWLYWPPGTLQLQGPFEELIGKLSDPDPALREQASDSLIAMGPQALGRLEALLTDPQAVPETQVRLEAIIGTLKAAAAGEDNGAAGLHGGRYAFDQCYFTSRGPRGQVRFYVEHCRDIRLDKTYHQSFVTLDADGVWNATVIPSKQWDREGLLKLPVNRFEDSKGGVWLHGGLRTSPDDHSIEPQAPDGLMFGDALAEDGEGRVYFDGTRGCGITVFDPAVTEAEPALQHRSFQGSNLALLPGEPIAWASDCWNWPHTLLRVGEKGEV